MGRQFFALSTVEERDSSTQGVHLELKVMDFALGTVEADVVPTIQRDLEHVAYLFIYLKKIAMRVTVISMALRHPIDLLTRIGSMNIYLIDMETTFLSRIL